MVLRSIALLMALLVLAGSLSAGTTTTLYTPTAGDATYGWNSKYGPYGYGVGGNDMGVGLYMGAPYGNDYTVSIFEIPIATLAGLDLTAATLRVESLGFGTGYYYGSAAIGWLDVGATVLTGDVVADGLGPIATGRPGGFTIYDSDTVPGTAGTKLFDVLTCVQADLAAGRAFTTFVMSGSRDTGGSIYTAESGNGPALIVETVPEPATMTLLGLGLVGLLRRRK